MDRSLTVLLPVRDVQSTLAAGVQQILEVLSDLTGRFELVIVDDGSIDATSEVLQELTRQYPQVRALCHGAPRGRDAAIRTGLEHSSGEIVVLGDRLFGGGVEEIRRLWLEGQRQPADPAPAVPRERQLRWATRHAGHAAGYQLLDRRESPRAAKGRPSRPNYLARLRTFAFGE